MEDTPIAKIDRLLSSDERQALKETLQTDGWKVIVKIGDQINDDWATQALSPDYRDMQDKQIVNYIILNQGMRRGLNLFLSKLDKWRKAQIDTK